MTARQPEPWQEQSTLAEESEKNQHLGAAEFQACQGLHAEAACAHIHQSGANQIEGHGRARDQQIPECDPERTRRLPTQLQQEGRDAHHFQSDVKTDQVCHHEAGVQSPEHHSRHQGASGSFKLAAGQTSGAQHNTIEQQKPGSRAIDAQADAVAADQVEADAFAQQQRRQGHQHRGQTAEQQGQFPQRRHQSTEKGQQIRRQ